MNIDMRKVGDVAILGMSGKMTIGKGDVELRKAFNKALEDGDRKIVFDMRKIGYMDSAAIGETVACAKQAQEVNAQIRILLTPKGKAEETLRIASLDRVFKMFHDEGEALVSFNA